MGRITIGGYYRYKHHMGGTRLNSYGCIVEYDMVRPDYHISHLLLGGIREYAAQHEIADEDAHNQLLNIALTEAGIISAEEEPKVTNGNSN